jgi:hypothetical protein
MPAGTLYRKHDSASQAKYQDTKRLAHSQRRILAGTPGTLKKRTQSGKQYWVREHIRVDGRKTDEYIGAVTTVSGKAAAQLAEEVELARKLARSSGNLRLFGFQRIDRKPAAVIETLCNKGLFKAGLTLVGSHAYGCLLNELGVIASGYRTEDIDLARVRPLAIALPEGEGLETLLKETGLDFVSVPGMPAHRPSASFKLPGAETLAVDLLVPGGKTGEILAVKELSAHAQAIPLLDFLVAEAMAAIVLSPNQVIPVNIPSPERFLVHKLFSSQSRRRSDRDKIRKDLEQAAVLSAAVEEETPGRTADAFRELPASGKPAARRGSLAASKLLHDAYPEAREVLLRIAR